MDRRRTDHTQPPLIISNAITRQLTHKMRSENQVILVGANTVLLDNPSLTVRNWSGKSPIRIAIDRQGRIPANFNLFDGSIPTLIFTEKDQTNKPNLEFIKIENEANFSRKVLQKIYEHNIHSVLIEGGAGILNCFIEAGLWDEANVEISPLRINDGIQAPQINALPVSKLSIEGHDWLFFKNNK